MFVCQRERPVAQRLEQGTHNSSKSVCMRFLRVAQHGSREAIQAFFIRTPLCRVALF